MRIFCGGFIAGLIVACVLSPLGVFLPHAEKKLPDTIMISGVQWHLEESSVISSDNSLAGLTDCSLRIIHVVNDADERETVMHEITHAHVCAGPETGFDLFNLYYNSSSNEKHEGIYRFSAFWADTLFRNPDLAAYLGNVR